MAAMVRPPQDSIDVFCRVYKAAGLSQTQAAHALGITPSYLSKLVTGKRLAQEDSAVVLFLKKWNLDQVQSQNNIRRGVNDLQARYLWSSYDVDTYIDLAPLLKVSFFKTIDKVTVCCNGAHLTVYQAPPR